MTGAPMEYIEVPRPPGDAECSDPECPSGTPGTAIARGGGYVYVSQGVVEFRRDARGLAEAALKIAHLQAAAGHPMFFGPGVVAPLLICKQGASRRNLDLEVAAADARYWWATGEVPLRPTPLAAEVSSPRPPPPAAANQQIQETTIEEAIRSANALTASLSAANASIDKLKELRDAGVLTEAEYRVRVGQVGNRTLQQIATARSTLAPQLPRTGPGSYPVGTPRTGRASAMTCKKCGRPMKGDVYTCPSCGHTQWAPIVGTGIPWLLLLGGGIFGNSLIADSQWRSIALWGGGIVGACGLFLTVGWVINGLRATRKPLVEPVGKGSNHRAVTVPDAAPRSVVAGATTPVEQGEAPPRLPRCATCNASFSWDESYWVQDTPGSAPYNPPGHPSWRPRAYCPHCGALVAEWHIDNMQDHDEWTWFGENGGSNLGIELPPSPLHLWGKSIPIELVPTYDEGRLGVERLRTREASETPHAPESTGAAVKLVQEANRLLHADTLTGFMSGTDRLDEARSKILEAFAAGLNDHDYACAIGGLGFLYVWNRGDVGHALQYCRESVERDASAYWQAHYVLSLIYSRSGDTERADAALRDARRFARTRWWEDDAEERLCHNVDDWLATGPGRSWLRTRSSS